MDPFWVLALVLVVSFISNVSPFFGAPYTLLAALQLNLLGATPFNFLAVVLVSAVGATVAKVAMYYGAFEFKGVLGRNRNVQLIGRNSSTPKFYVALFTTALLPIFPLDDFIYIGAGATSASIGAMAGVTLLAKVLKSALEIAVELTILVDVKNVFGFDRIESTVALSLLFVLMGVAFYKLDWKGTYDRLRGRASPRRSDAS